jgi:hypothetical protein
LNIWRRGSLLDNPYHRTAFRIARVPPEIIRRSTLVTMLGQTRRLVRGAPDAHVILGQPVTEADLNAADTILLDAKQRMLEELLEHTEEQIPLDQVRQVQSEVMSAMADPSSGPLVVENLAAVRAWVEVMLREFLAQSPTGHPSFGALELELVSPFGRPEDSQS